MICVISRYKSCIEDINELLCLVFNHKNILIKQIQDFKEQPPRSRVFKKEYSMFAMKCLMFFFRKCIFYTFPFNLGELIFKAKNFFICFFFICKYINMFFFCNLKAERFIHKNEVNTHLVLLETLIMFVSIYSHFFESKENCELNDKSRYE